ncbi:hypothetical protein DRQ20_03640 [bacterium]|nr:MAG: hypothetical protein DRQ20_03640 [bacterium]
MEEKIREALKEVVDPELGINVVDLGLIYGIECPSPEEVKIRMTLTVKGCPLAHFLTQQVKERVEKIEGVKKVEVELVWDPPWNPSMVSPEVKKRFGIQ